MYIEAAFIIEITRKTTSIKREAHKIVDGPTAKVSSRADIHEKINICPSSKKIHKTFL